ncbi:uncharacterized protein B0I36DRAFT_406604, partial [Microdochium trichocladiopsis]
LFKSAATRTAGVCGNRGLPGLEIAYNLRRAEPHSLARCNYRPCLHRDSLAGFNLLQALPALQRSNSATHPTAIRAMPSYHLSVLNAEPALLCFGGSGLLPHQRHTCLASLLHLVLCQNAWRFGQEDTNIRADPQMPAGQAFPRAWSPRHVAAIQPSSRSSIITGLDHK